MADIHLGYLVLVNVLLRVTLHCFSMTRCVRLKHSMLRSFCKKYHPQDQGMPCLQRSRKGQLLDCAALKRLAAGSGSDITAAGEEADAAAGHAERAGRGHQAAQVV